MSLVRCTRCVIPTTKPDLLFNDQGVCQACLNYDQRRSIDWESRYVELEDLCLRDSACVVAVSGGKDSHFLVAAMHGMGCTCLLMTVTDPFTKTKAGKHNLANLQNMFGDQLLSWTMPLDLFVKATRAAFERRGEPLRFIEACIYTIPITWASFLSIPLVVFGENSAYEYGSTLTDVPSAAWSYAASMGAPEQIANWEDLGLTRAEITPLLYPQNEHPSVIYLSRYVPWDGEAHYKQAKRSGFQDLTGEWDRTGNIESYDQIDSIGYIVHLWLKYPKFGYARATDIACRWIQKGKITREEGLRLAEERDHRLDPRALDDFCQTLGYSTEQFWTITERFWNRDLFEKVRGEWRLRP